MTDNTALGVPEWDTTASPTTSAADIATYYMADGVEASTAAFALLGRAIECLHPANSRTPVNSVKAHLFFDAAIATGFDLTTGYDSYETLLARFGLPS